MNVYYIDKYETFYRELYFMTPDVFYTHLVKLQNRYINEQYKCYTCGCTKIGRASVAGRPPWASVAGRPPWAFIFYTRRLDSDMQIDLFSIINTRKMYYIRHLNKIGIFFDKMQNYFFREEFKLPKTLHRKLPKVLVSIINEYIPKHFIDLYKTFDSCQKKNLVKWYKSKLHSF